MELTSLYKTLKWHETQKDREANESVGLFIALPQEFAEQYPEKSEDTSPPHITVLYLGDTPPQFEDSIIEVAKEVCENFKKFKIKIKKPKTFENHKNQTIYHSPIFSPKLHIFNKTLKRAFQLRQIPIDSKFPDYKPHITIEYVDQGEERKFEDVRPEGEFVVDGVWLWRFI